MFPPRRHTATGATVACRSRRIRLPALPYLWRCMRHEGDAGRRRRNLLRSRMQGGLHSGGAVPLGFVSNSQMRSRASRITVEEIQPRNTVVQVRVGRGLPPVRTDSGRVDRPGRAAGSRSTEASNSSCLTGRREGRIAWSDRAAAALCPRRSGQSIRAVTVGRGEERGGVGSMPSVVSHVAEGLFPRRTEGRCSDPTRKCSSTR